MKTERDFLWESVNDYIRETASIIYERLAWPNKKERGIACLNGLAGFLEAARIFAPDWLQPEIDDVEKMYWEIEREIWETCS